MITLLTLFQSFELNSYILNLSLTSVSLNVQKSFALQSVTFNCTINWTFLTQLIFLQSFSYDFASRIIIMLVKQCNFLKVIWLWFHNLSVYLTVELYTSTLLAGILWPRQSASLFLTLSRKTSAKKTARSSVIGLFCYLSVIN